MLAGLHKKLKQDTETISLIDGEMEKQTALGTIFLKIENKYAITQTEYTPKLLKETQKNKE